MPFGPEKLPIYWLDQADDAQSLSILDNLYTSSDQEKMKKRILTIAGLHGTSEHAVAFLEKVLKSTELESLRARAAKDDRSFDVRKYSVYGLKDINLASAGDALIDIA
jgi:hypothetical protein